MMDKVLVRKANKIDVLLRNVDGTNDADFKRLINYLNQFKLLELFDLLSQNKHLFHQLRQPRYDAYWNGELLSLPVGSEDEPFSFKIPQHISSLEFMMGYVFAYQLAAETTFTLRDKCELFLRLASEYHSLHALNMGVQSILASIYEAGNPLNEQLIMDCISQINSEACYHGTPGYLLAASFYFDLMGFARQQRALISDAEQRQEAFALEDGYLVTAYYYVVLAELSETDSPNEMHNFFRELANPAFNPFPVTSIKEIAPWFQKAFSNALTKTRIQQIKEQAEIQLQKEQKSLHDSKIALASHNLNLPAGNPTVCLQPDQRLNCYQETELLLAVRQGKPEVVAGLLKIYDKKAITAQDYHGNTVLHLAVLTESYELAVSLARDYPELCDIPNKYGDRVIDLVDDAAYRPLFKPKSSQENRFQFFTLLPDLLNPAVSNDNFPQLPYDKKK